MDVKDAGEFKRGDTLAFTAHIINPLTQEAYTGLVPYLKCEGRYGNGTLGLEMTISEYDDGSGIQGMYLFYNNNTGALTPGTLFFDIQLINYIDETNTEFETISSTTFTLTVVKDETR